VSNDPVAGVPLRHASHIRFRVDNAQSCGPYLEAIRVGGSDARAFIGVCINHRMQGERYLGSLLSWTLERVGFLRVVILDSLERHNVQVFNQRTPYEAACQVLAEGDRVFRRARRLLAEMGAKHASVVRFGDLLRQPQYSGAIREIEALYRSNRSFHEAVHRELDAFIGTVIRSRPQRYEHYVYPQDVAPLAQYLIEEVGVYLALFREGFSVEVFPGRDSALLVDLAAGQYGEAFQDYSARTHVSLVPEKEDIVNE